MSVNTKVNGQLVKSAGLYKTSVPIQSGDIYSFEERQVGVWTDGKPLYQKTIDFGELPNNTTKQVNHNVSNIETVVEIKGVSYVNNLIYGENLPPVTAGKAFRASVRENVVEVSSTDNWTGYNARITFKYTKTTDVAGSGEYVPSGDKAEHYSTDEEVIGTWIDGKTLYRKVLEIPISNKNTDYDVSSLNVDKMINLYGACGNFHLPLNTVHETSALPYAIGLNYGNDYIQIRFGASENIITPCYVVCEYTKTS